MQAERTRQNANPSTGAFVPNAGTKLSNIVPLPHDPNQTGTSWHRTYRSSYGPKIVRLVSVLAMAACGPSRTPPITPTPVAAGRVFTQINVHIMDTAWSPLADAGVEIQAQSQPVASAISDINGNAAFSGTFFGVVTFRAAKETFVTATQNVDLQSVVGTPNVLFYLESVTPPVNIATGDYILTFAADSACTTLPSDVRMRTYAATLAPDRVPSLPADTQYFVTVAGTSSWCCLGPGSPGRFGIGVAGNHVAVSDDTGDQIIEHLASFRYLEFSIFGDASREPSGASTMSFAGALDYCELRSDIGNGFCRSASADQVITHVVCQGNSRFTLTKR